ncbi:nitroreductase family protein [Aquimarina sp. ERC-38]|uniref:nitroreductase family protein n=1 Tax=Aquimarina sp. ERC-38 TaxID=2949996 RepID=UPI0022468F6F|nr:nitroreductase family protein [Aquimarina sp. ERC-38]UZO82471.1 nitroreductase family protein [Aquimarina sp. ERC-38]
METKLLTKTANTEYEINMLLKERFSPRVFSDMPVSDTDLHSLLEAGRWAASSNNLQPWRIIWGVKGSKSYDRIFNCLDEFNQSWAGNAPVLWLTLIKKSMPNGKENFHALHDLGLFMGNVSIQAQSMGIAVHEMAGVKFEEAKKEFEVPEDFHVVTAVSIGYYGGDPDQLPEDLQETERESVRKRMLQVEFAFEGNFVDRADLGNKK